MGGGNGTGTCDSFDQIGCTSHIFRGSNIEKSRFSRENIHKIGFFWVFFNNPHFLPMDCVLSWSFYIDFNEDINTINSGLAQWHHTRLSFSFLQFEARYSQFYNSFCRIFGLLGVSKTQGVPAYPKINIFTAPCGTHKTSIFKLSTKSYIGSA